MNIFLNVDLLDIHAAKKIETRYITQMQDIGLLQQPF